MADIKGVEIMSLGTWNGTQITESTFKQIIDGFEANKEFASVPLKLGHNNEQKLLQEDGLPAAGWVSNLYIQGKKLLADFSDIPSKIYELIKRKAYRKVSVELFSGYKFQGTEYPCLLGAVALLGSDLPAMANLNDILETYGMKAKGFSLEENPGNIQTILTFDIGEETVAQPENKSTELEELRAKFDAQAKQLAQVTEQVATFKKSNDDLEQYKNNTEKKIAELEAEKNKVLVENFCLDLAKKELLSPSMKPLVEGLLASTQGLKKFSVGEKETDVQGAVEQLLTLAKEVFKINKTENTTEGKKTEGDKTEEYKQKIEDLMKKDPNLSWTAAYKLAMKQ